MIIVLRLFDSKHITSPIEAILLFSIILVNLLCPNNMIFSNNMIYSLAVG
jgi:hypothetical protein